MFLGTTGDNVRDAAKKNMIHKGENHYAAKFTDNDILNIRDLSENGESNGNIAKLFGVRPQTISKIVLRRRWKHI